MSDEENQSAAEEVIENCACTDAQAFLADLAAQGMTLADLDNGAVEWYSTLIGETADIVEGAEMSDTV